jgi:putative sterol carrier protein
MEVRTPREFFEKTMPTRFNPNKAKDVEATVQMTVTGPNGGHWTIIIKNQKMTVKEETHPSPTIGIRISDSDFIDLVNGKLSGIEALMTGKLEFKGSFGAGMKLLETGLI